MNMKFVKRFIAVTMAATLMVAPAITASAATEDSQGSAQQAATEAAVTTAEVKTEAVASVSGAVIKSDVAGAYAVGTSKVDTAISAVVPRESAAQIKSEAGLAANEAPYVQAYDITEKKAPKAYDSAKSVAAAVNGRLDGAINLKLAKKSGKTVTNLSADVAVPMTFALKKAVPAGMRAVVLKISAGGAFTVLEDLGTTPGAITVPVTGGDAAYFIMYVPAA